jgi:proteasome lid subunit RPN8/RPN11
VTLSDGVYFAIVNHARQLAPEECCGLLVGDESRILDAMPAENLAPDPVRRYLVDPRDHLHAIRTARARGLQVVGAYHSHPHSPAVPSATDASEAFSDFLFLIVGLATEPPELTAWSWSKGNFVAVPLVRLERGRDEVR